MNVLKIIFFLGLGQLLCIMSACEKETSTIDNFTASEIQNIMESGDWVIANFNDSGKDETRHFVGFKFSFMDKNVLIASSSQSAITGRWDIAQDSSDDSNSSGIDFNIYFDSASGEFEELIDDWDVISRSSTKIELIDVSGGNGGTDYLTFERM